MQNGPWELVESSLTQLRIGPLLFFGVYYCYCYIIVIYLYFYMTMYHWRTQDSKVEGTAGQGCPYVSLSFPSFFHLPLHFPFVSFFPLSFYSFSQLSFPPDHCPNRGPISQFYTPVKFRGGMVKRLDQFFVRYLWSNLLLKGALHDVRDLSSADNNDSDKISGLQLFSGGLIMHIS